MNFLESPPNVVAFVCLHVSKKKRSANYVFHHSDGRYSMLCGFADCDANDPSNLQIVALGTMFEHNPDLKNLDYLEPGFEAARETNGSWVISEIPEEN